MQNESYVILNQRKKEKMKEYERELLPVEMASHDGTNIYHSLSAGCPEKLWEAFEADLKKSGIKVLCGNVSALINYEGTSLVNKAVRTCVSEESHVTAAVYCALNNILMDMLNSGHNCISIRQPLHVKNLTMDGSNVYRVYIRYLTGRDIDEDTFKQAVMLASPSLFSRE